MCDYWGYCAYMIADERFSFILERLKSQRAVTVSELTSLLRVSAETIRRDLMFLEKQNRLQRVHGGAVNANMSKTYPSLPQRQSENIRQKREAAQAAIGLIREGDSIVIDTGSTAYEFVSVLKTRIRKLTVVTHSVRVFEELRSEPEIRLILIGGEYLSREDCFYGAAAIDAIQKLHVSLCFIFPSAVSLKYGVADYVTELVPIQKSYIEISNRAVILADSSKFEKTALLKICDTDNRCIFVTSADLEDSVYQLYKENDIRLYRDKETILHEQENNPDLG